MRARRPSRSSSGAFAGATRRPRRSGPRKTGWNLAAIAAMTDDFEAVKELCKRDDAIELMSMVGKKIKVKHEHQKLPFAQMLIHMANGHIPLMGAMGYARPEIVTCMLEAGCPFKGRAVARHLLRLAVPPPDRRHLQRPQGELRGVHEGPPECGRSHEPRRHGHLLPELPAHCVRHRPSQHQADGRVAPQLGQDPKPLLHQRMGMGSTPTGMLAFNEDADVSALSLLVSAPIPRASRRTSTHASTHYPFLWFMYHTMGVLSALGHSSSASMHKMFKSFIVIGTPLHWAAMLGNVPMIGALLDLGADPTVQVEEGDKALPGCKGLTPYEILQYKFPDSPSCRRSQRCSRRRATASA